MRRLLLFFLLGLRFRFLFWGLFLIFGRPCFFEGGEVNNYCGVMRRNLVCVLWEDVRCRCLFFCGLGLGDLVGFFGYSCELYRLVLLYVVFPLS